MSTIQHQRIAELCEQFRLERIAAECPALAQKTIDDTASLGDFLEQLLKLEVDSRDERRRQTLLRVHRTSGEHRVVGTLRRGQEPYCCRPGLQVRDGWTKRPVYYCSRHDAATGCRSSPRRT
ncbi:ATP-binding protein [Serratia symbiotica]|uniref:ATP-binding protein n=1 Tax=Serratia symbiotica TaxID=138074 RepID=UPI00254650B0|nr:ATP-binding protein [Serratia symbiotica]